MYIEFMTVYGEEVIIVSEEIKVKKSGKEGGKHVVLHGNNTHVISEEEFERINTQMRKQYEALTQGVSGDARIKSNTTEPEHVNFVEIIKSL